MDFGNTVAPQNVVTGNTQGIQTADEYNVFRRVNVLTGLNSQQYGGISVRQHMIIEFIAAILSGYDGLGLDENEMIRKAISIADKLTGI